MSRGYFVTGTDTGVGKTLVTAALGLALLEQGRRVAVMKPVETGCSRRNGLSVPGDAAYLKRMLKRNDALDTICPVRLGPAIAPLSAARLQGEAITLRRLMTPFRTLRASSELLLVEGVGGVSVPLNRRMLLSDLATRFNLPLIVVARTALGTVNHTLLTLEHARIRNVPVAGLVFNRISKGRFRRAEKAGMDEIRFLSGVPVLGTLPHLAKKDHQTLCREGLKLLQNLDVAG